MSLKQKTISGLLWSSVESIASQGIQFIFGIILARLLSPKEFGLIGMMTIFIAVSESFINSGFSSALIRKKKCTQTDYSTVFFFNLATGMFFFVILFLSASPISGFFREPGLKSIVQVLSLVLIIDSVTIIQRTILTKRIDFKLQTKVTLISSFIAGMVAVILAYKGFGVWSLVIQTLLRQALNSFFLWLWNNWRPSMIFSKDSFRELFGFGSKILLSGLIDTVYRNVYYLIIGKYFSAEQLGYYTRANQFESLPTKNITNIMTRVSYPVLAQMQDDPVMLKSGYKKMIRSTMLVTFLLTLGLSAVAEPVVISFIGEKWRVSVVYLQLMCFSGMFYPLHAINLNMLNVQGRSDLFLKLEVIKKLLVIPTIIIGVMFGIKIMLIGMIANSIIAYFLNSYYSGKLINYSTKEQLKDILPSFLIGGSIAIIVFLLGHFLTMSYIIKLILQLITGAVIFFGYCELTRMSDYLYLKQIAVDNVLKRKLFKSHE